MIPWILLALACLIVLVLLLRPWRRPTRTSATFLRQQFVAQRHRLQPAFLEQAASSGKPRGLRWIQADWDETITLVHDRVGNLPVALVAVTLQFEAIAGGDMEDVPAVADSRRATGVFLWHNAQWHATGRVVFNLTPAEVLERYPSQYELLEPSHRS